MNGGGYPFPEEVQTVATVGTGVIGASWAAEYLARGFDVVSNARDLRAEPKARKQKDAQHSEQEHRQTNHYRARESCSCS